MSFLDLLREILRLARRSNELAGLLTGLEFADERSWLDAAGEKQLKDGLAEEKEVGRSFAERREMMRAAYPNEWRAYLEKLRDASTDKDVRERLQQELDDAPAKYTLEWALAVAPKP